MRIALQHFCTQNLMVVLFVYGLSFFSLGLAIMTTRIARRYKPLRLDDGMRWLAAFGFAHGLHEWGSMFIPLQGVYLSSRVLAILQVLHVILLAASFAFLLRFGLTFFPKWGKASRLLPLGLFGGWLLLAFLPAWLARGGGQGWEVLPAVWARYILGLPGGLIAAAGLFRYVRHDLHGPAMRPIAGSLTVAAGALGAYAFLGGAVVDPLNFFPANWLNTATVVSELGIPIYVFRAFDGLVLAAVVINAMKVFDLEIERRLEMLKVQQNITRERERIARELHDHTIQTIYAAGLSLESIMLPMPPGEPLARQLSGVVASLNTAIDNLRAYIGDLRPMVGVEDLEAGIRSQIDALNLPALLEVSVDIGVPADIQCNAIRTTHILAIVREALSNVIRHAHAREVSVRAYLAEGDLVIVVQDDGKGFLPAATARGYGLRNMHDRARLLNGRVVVQSELGKGTRVVLTVPTKEKL